MKEVEIVVRQGANHIVYRIDSAAVRGYQKSYWAAEGAKNRASGHEESC